MILTETGEIGVHAGDRVHVLRPSLYAMSQIGEPAQIVEIYAAVMTEGLQGKASADQFGEALAIIHACADADVSDLFGQFYFSEHRQRFIYRRGLADPKDVLILARSLLRHGITGVLPPLPRKAGSEEEYSAEFVARDYVALAIAHLGMSEREAWAMTMTGLVSALRAKFPQPESQGPGAKAPSKEQHAATEAWFDKIEAKRKARNQSGV